MVTFRCPTCQNHLQAQETEAGNKLSCSHCGQRLKVPGSLPVNKTVLGEWAGGNAIATSPLPPVPTAPSKAPLPPAIPPPNVSWFYEQDGRERGPVSEERMRELIRTGDLEPRDMVWAAGMRSWTPARDQFSFPSRRRDEDYDDGYDDDYDDRDLRIRRRPENSNSVCSLLSCIFGGIAFLLCPPIFGLAGLILGIIGVCQEKNKALATVGIVLSAVGMVFGMILGAMLSQAFNPRW